MGDSPIRSPRVAVVVLNFNGLDDTIKCLDSLRPLTEQGHEVILVDNGSSVDPEVPARDVLPALTYLKNAQNLGYAGGNNTGIRCALDRGAEFVLVLNNDTVVAPSIVDELLTVFAAHAELGIVGPVVNFMDEQDLVMTDGVAFNPGPGTEFFKRIIVPPSAAQGAAVPVDIVNGCCMMIRSDVFRRVGLFDEQFFIVHEESDLCLKAGRSGFGCAVFSRTLVWHKGSSAFERSGRQLQRYFDARNLFYLIRRHAGKAGRSRGVAATLPHYLKYCFYRFDVELDAGKPAAARAVLEGAADALAGRVGPYAAHRRPAASLLGLAFSARRRLRGSTSSQVSA
jgi:GT2 family glycosyltransferase